MIGKVVKYRTKQWWQPKAGLILSAVYLSVLINHVSFTDLVIYFLPAVFTILGIGIMGYFINDLFDRKYDEKAQKINILHNKPVSFLITLFFSSLLVALLPWLFLPFDIFSLGLLVSEFVLLVLYAIHPVRLKERGFLALLADAFYAYVIPFVLAFHTFSLLGKSTVSLISLYIASICWLLITGIYNLAIHQLEDYNNDKQANIKTWTNAIGKTVAYKWSLYYLWPLQMVIFLALSVVLFFYHPLTGIFFTAIVLLKTGATFSQSSRNIYYLNREVQYLQQINFHYHLWLPYLLIFLLTIGNYYFVVILAAHILLFNHKYVIWFYDEYFIWFWNHLKAFISHIVNHAIYYFFRLFGINLKKEKKSALKYIKDKLK